MGGSELIKSLYVVSAPCFARSYPKPNINNNGQTISDHNMSGMFPKSKVWIAHIGGPA
jgi:hypothetical protein